MSTKDQDAFRSLCAHVRDSMSVPRGVIIVVFFFSPGSCELCSSEVNYGWILAGEAVHRNLRIFAFSVDENEQDGQPPVNLPQGVNLLHHEVVGNVPLHQFAGKCAVFDTDNSMLSYYKIGATNGFEHSYRAIDSILYYRDTLLLTSLQPTGRIIIPIDTSINIDRSKIIFLSGGKKIELFDPKIARCCLYDSTGRLIREDKLRSYCIETDSVADLLDEFFYLTDTSAILHSYRSDRPVDTTLYNNKTRFFRRTVEMFFSINLTSKKETLLSQYDPPVGAVSEPDERSQRIWTMCRPIHDKDSMSCRFLVTDPDTSFLMISTITDIEPSFYRSFIPRDSTIIALGRSEDKFLYLIKSNGFRKVRLSYYERHGKMSYIFSNTDGLITLAELNGHSSVYTSFTTEGLRSSPLVTAPSDTRLLFYNHGRSAFTVVPDANLHTLGFNRYSLKN